MNLECPNCHETIATPQTLKQAETLAYITEFQRVKGHRPTMRQIGRHFNVTAPTIHKRVESLRRQGFLDQVPLTEQRIDTLLSALNQNLN